VGAGRFNIDGSSDGIAMITNNPLLGSWQLVRWDITYGDGRPPSLPYGEQATGLIVYTGDGFMSACIAAACRAPMSSASVRSAPEAERLAAFESYFQYAGRYELRRSATGLQVVHRVSHSLNPNFVGSEQVRNVAFDAVDVLTLSASDTVPNSAVARHHRLMWKRPA
jgi:Lipocalin-like domain